MERSTFRRKRVAVALLGAALAVGALAGVAAARLTSPSDAAGASWAAKQAGGMTELHFYDWESNLIGPERAIGGHPGQAPPGGALRASEGRWRRAGRSVRSFENRQLIYAGAYPTAYQAAKLAGVRKPPRSGGAIRVPPGIVLVSEHPTDEVGELDETARPGWYVLRDHPVLSGADITEPEPAYGRLGEPIVSFGFTEKGRRAFQEVTRAIAQRGQAQAIGPVSREQAAALSGHFAIVIGGEVRTRPIVNFAENPDGIDGRNGAEISGGFRSMREARQLARALRAGAAPARPEAGAW